MESIGIDDANKNTFSLKLDESSLNISVFLETAFQDSSLSIVNILFDVLHVLSAIWHFFHQFSVNIHLQE